MSWPEAFAAACIVGGLLCFLGYALWLRERE